MMKKLVLLWLLSTVVLLLPIASPVGNGALIYSNKGPVTATNLESLHSFKSGEACSKTC